MFMNKYPSTVHPAHSQLPWKSLPIWEDNFISELHILLPLKQRFN